MKVYSSLREIRGRLPRVYLTIGVFDGFHLGHKRVIEKTLALARRGRGQGVVFTFGRHPLRVVDRRFAPSMLMTAEERLDALRTAGVETVLMVDFNRRWQSTGPEEFIRSLLEKLELKAVLVGPDFRFGDDRAGDTALLREWGRREKYKVVVLPPLLYHGQRISSSRIRQAVSYGYVRVLPSLLGRPYAVRGQVVGGRGLGRELGAPTFNLASPGRLLPKIGVYLVRARTDRGKEYWGLANVGRNPTVTERGRVHLEVHLLDFRRGKVASLQVSFIDRLREEKKFDGLAGLKAQILADIARAGKMIEAQAGRGRA